MDWVENNIDDAVKKSKILNSLFIVLVEDDNVSEQEAWTNDELKNIAVKNKCVLVRIKANSATEAQFKQIFPVSTYPIVYFIGDKGKVLLTVKGVVTPQELIGSFNKALELHKSAEVAPSNQPSTSHNEDVAMQGDTHQKNESQSETAQKEKIKHDIEEARKLKNKEYQERFKKQKEQEQELKNRIIEEENLERQKAENARKKIAMIQFKLPDGSSVVQSFKAEDKLQDAKSFIINHLRGRIRNIKLSQLRPKVVVDDFEKTFADYNFAPSAVLVVLFQEDSVSAPSNNLIVSLWAKFILILQFFLSWIIPSSPNQASSSSTAPANQANDNPSQSKPSQPNAPNQGLRQRREGNVRRLMAVDDNDDSATWNGNSTQQM